ncbi:hypothetical protein HZB94_02655, partial [Candidatus Falkowbacteria bacterium]|nr:hypothetical protein [Candidatus Falkowbacteria bacterium]
MFKTSKTEKNKKVITILIVLFFILQTANPILWMPKEAVAIMAVEDVPVLGAITGTAVSEKGERTAKEVKESVFDKIFKGMVLTAAVTLRNTLIMMSKRAAEQTVTYISTGSWGQGAMFWTEAWGTFKENLTYYIIGQFLDNLNAMFGIDICQPGTPEFEFGLKLGLQFAWLEDPQLDKLKKPNCDLQKLSHNWGALVDGIRKKYEAVIGFAKADPYHQAYMSVAVLNEVFDVSYSREKSGIGMKLTVEDKAAEEIRKKQEAEAKQREENQGAKGITSPGREYIKTPSWLTKSHSESELEAAKSTPKEELSPAGDVMASVPGSIAVAFLNTFVSKMWTDYILKKFFEKGLVNPTASYNPLQKTFDTKENLQKEFAMQTINLAFTQKQIDLLSEYSTCPEFRGLNNCVMDNSFAEAVRRATQDKPLTVQGAIDAKLLKGDLPFIGVNDDRNKDDDCYTIGYCYSNLVKLRRARIIPIGWEIAANLVEPGMNKNLNDLINDFSAASSPFYKLVDPNWVLRYPETQCKATVSGQLLIGSGADERSEACVDMTSCVKTNEDGSCAATGYCAAERNVFRFGGKQCNGAYDSCRTLQTRTGKTASYLMNTVDSGVCNADNVGCKWYSTLKNISAGTLVSSELWSSADADKIYLNKKIEDQECSPKSDGCTRFIRTKAGMGTNLIPNGGFEINDGKDDSLANSTSQNVPGWGNQKLTNDAFSGKAGLLLVSNEKAEQSVQIAPAKYKRFFTLSGKIKPMELGEGATINLSSDVTGTLVQKSQMPVAADIMNKQDEWVEIKRTYELMPLAGASDITDSTKFATSFTIQIEPNKKVIVDELMLEEIDEPTLEASHSYVDYATKNDVHLKKAPDYLKCYNVHTIATPPNQPMPDLTLYGKPKISAQITIGDDVVSTDKLSGCDKYAKLCSAEEVGCEAYKPTDGGATMNGIASYYDYCPKECAGYNAFSMSETYFEDGEFPKFLIPSTAKKCNAANAGCDEFTNLDVLAAGGEAKEYYKELRHCAKLPEKQSSCSTFYTWEGSEVTGYQLQSHNLQKAADGSPDIVNPTSNASACDKNIFNAKTNPDCRQFYDKDGKVFYKLYSKTIFCSADCHPFRRTLKYTGQIDAQNIAECTGRNGEWKSGECVFWAIQNQGVKCSAENNACREYRGNQAGIEFEVENYTFSAGTDSDLSELQASKSTLKTSPEYGQYLNVSKGNSSYIYLATKPDKVIFGAADYNVSFWIKQASSAGNFGVGLKADAADAASAQIMITDNNVNLSTEWKFHTFQIIANSFVDFSNKSSLTPSLVVSST